MPERNVVPQTLVFLMTDEIDIDKILLMKVSFTCQS